MITMTRTQAIRTRSSLSDPADDLPEKTPTQRLNDKLSKGRALGSLKFKPNNSAFLVYIKYSTLITSTKTRGLFAAEDIPANSVICRATGSREFGEAPINSYWIHISSNPYTVLILNSPTVEYPGAIVNTAGQHLKNNSTFSYHPRYDYVTIRSKTNIKSGDEILVPYGSSLTRQITIQRPIFMAPVIKIKIQDIPKNVTGMHNPSMLANCPMCHEKMAHYKIKHHYNNYKCIKNQQSLAQVPHAK